MPAIPLRSYCLEFAELTPVHVAPTQVTNRQTLTLSPRSTRWGCFTLAAKAPAVGFPSAVNYVRHYISILLMVRQHRKARSPPQILTEMQAPKSLKSLT
jgi:hypothetical protein